MTADPLAPIFRAPLWTGRLVFELRNGRGWSIGTAELVARLDTVTLWLNDRSLATMDRDTFREWLIHPHQPYEVDDVIWSMQTDVTCLTIDHRLPCTVDPATTGALIGII